MVWKQKEGFRDIQQDQSDDNKLHRATNEQLQGQNIYNRCSRIPRIQKHRWQSMVRLRTSQHRAGKNCLLTEIGLEIVGGF